MRRFPWGTSHTLCLRSAMMVFAFFICMLASGWKNKLYGAPVFPAKLYGCLFRFTGE